MQETLFKCLVLSLMITAIHAAFLEGNILFPVKVKGAKLFEKLLGWKWAKIVQKPLYDCLTCMASVWTIALTWSFDIKTILVVCGINVIIEKVLDNDGLKG